MRVYKLKDYTIYYASSRAEIPSVSKLPFPYIINFMDENNTITGGECQPSACTNCPLKARFPDVRVCNKRAQLFLTSASKIIRTKELT